MEWIFFFENGFWFGLAALGFGILFNVPGRALAYLFLIGMLGGLMKTLLLNFGINIILSSLGGAIFVGYLSNYAAHARHVPPMVFAIPSVIPMVPGIFAYKMMLGIIKLSSAIDDEYIIVLSETINNGLKAILILLSLALGVAIPLLVARKETVKRKKKQ